MGNFRSYLSWMVFTYIIILAGCRDKDVSFRQGTKATVTPTKEQEANLSRVYTKEFKAGEINQVNIEVNSDFNMVTQTFKLSQSPGTEEIFTQIDRPIMVSNFTQGFDGWSESQRFSAHELGKLDLLIVVDNSPSMADIRKRLGASLSPLLKHISNTNWQIAVVTTSSSCLISTAKGKRVISRGDLDKDEALANETFRELLNTDGSIYSTIEKGILTASEGLIGNCGNEHDDWKREGAKRAVLIISDEKNCGSAVDEGCVGEAYSSANYFLDRYDDVQVFGMFLLENNFALCKESGGYDDPEKGHSQDPVEYKRLVETTGGRFGEVCQNDYTSILEQISADLKDDAVKSFELAYEPEDGKIEVTLDGVPLKAGFKLSGKIVTITDKTIIPESASLIEIAYLHDSVERRKEFKINGTADPKTIVVEVNDEKIEEHEYEYDQISHQIRFVDTPNDLAKISVKYRENTGLPKRFILSGVDVLQDSIKISVGGSDVKDFVFDEEGRAVDLVSPPEDGDRVVVVYENLNDRKTHYNVEGVGIERIEGVKFFDAQTLAPVEGELIQGKIVFSPHEVYDGREVSAQYDLIYSGEELDFDISVSQEPLLGSVHVSADGKDFEICQKNLKVDADSISFSCEGDDVTKINVNYSYIDNYTNKFPIDAIFQYYKEARWQVFVNGVEITTYERTEDNIVIPEKFLPPGGAVKVIRTPLVDQTIADSN